jgi:hypothetical protein
MIYLHAYDQQRCTVAKLVDDPSNAQYGMPELYVLHADGSEDGMQVHASRVVHIAERARFSRVYGTPRLKAVFNRLIDLDKVIGSSAEAYWKLVYKGMVLSTRDGYSLPSGADSVQALEAKIEDYVNDLRRFLVLDGIELQDLGSANIDPSNLVDVIMSTIASTTGVPKRLLLGSELGELASSQDASSWAGRVSARRTRFAEPVILNPLIKRLQFVGALPQASSSNGHSWRWQTLLEQSDTERAAAAKAYAEALIAAASAAARGAVDLAEFREKMTPFVNEPSDVLDLFDAASAGDIAELERVATGAVANGRAFAEHVRGGSALARALGEL